MSVPPKAWEQLVEAYHAPSARRSREGDRLVRRILIWSACIATLTVLTVLGCAVAITVAVLS